MRREGALVCFMHINKNGGATVRRMLRNNYMPSAFLEVMIQGRRGVDGRAKTVDGLDEDIHQAVTELQNRQHELACIAANLPFGVGKYLARPVAYFTFLREPVSRCISYWYFAYHNRRSGRLWSVLEEYEFDVRRIVGDHAAYQLSNDQVRMVTGTSAPEPGQAELQLARELIEERFLLAGATDYFDACLRELSRLCGWRVTAGIRENEGMKADASLLPPKAEKWFREANEWDLRLYEWLLNDYLPRKL